MPVLCPNHHAAVHRCDAPLDFGDHAFAGHREVLQLNQRLA